MFSYKAQYGQSIYDICLMTYGSLSLLFSLMTENNIDSINTKDFTGKTFIFDGTKITNNTLYQNNISDGVNYITGTPITELYLLTENDLVILTESGIGLLI